MSPFMYYFLATAHGVIFTLNIITAWHLAPIINTPMGVGEMSEAALYGMLMSMGIIASAGASLGVYPSDSLTDFSTKILIAIVHSAMLTGMAIAVYYYVPMLIS